MKKLLNFLIILVALAFTSSQDENLLSRDEILNKLNIVRSKTSPNTQRTAALGVITRILPNHFHLFDVEIVNNIDNSTYKNSRHRRAFEIVKYESDETVLIRATDGVTACKAFYYYLKYYLNGHVSWSDVQLDSIPNKMPNIHYKQYSPSEFLYHQNVCTWGYSFVWWKWADWRKHIDWMALMGITLTIAPIQEAIWTKVYEDIGLTRREIDDHLAGPAFLPWQRMGNMRGWSGPLSDGYKHDQLNLQKQILNAQRELGMTIALPAFAGHVPVSFQRIYPNKEFESATRWMYFPEEYCCPIFIDPNDNLFHEIGYRFLREVIKEYGTDHIYFTDPFNEMHPQNITPEYMAETASSIYSSMASVDPNAVWLLQGWFFVQNVHWSDEILRSFLTAVPQGNLLILDLQSELAPQYERTKSYYGQPFIWCMLHNFGGTLGMHGSIDIVNMQIAFALNMENSTMIGVGITQEGINQNYALYEFALERGWSDFSFNVDIWLQLYASARYGIRDTQIDKAWKLIRETVYKYEGPIQLHGDYTIAVRPGMDIKPWVWYDPSEFTKAWKYLLNPRNKKVFENKLYQNDLIDVTRQVLQLTGDILHILMMEAYEAKNLNNFRNYGDLMIRLFDDLDKILSTNENFLLGKWLESAKAMGKTELEKEIYEMNARSQITIWGPYGEINDYATKQWSGIVRNYFKPRWQMFIKYLKSSLITETEFNHTIFNQRVFKDIELPFTVDQSLYPVHAKGDPIKISKQLYKKWIVFIPSTYYINFFKISIKTRFMDFLEYL